MGTEGSKSSIKEWYQGITAKYAKLRGVLDLLFIVVLMMVVLGYALRTTTFAKYSGDIIIEVGMKLLLLMVFLRFFFCFEKLENTLFAAFFCIVLAVIHFFYPTRILFIFGMSIIGSIGIDFRKILKAFVITVGTVVGFSIFTSFTGSSENLVYLWDGGKLRDSFGICYPTDFATYLFFLIVFFWIAWDRLPHWITMIFTVAILFVVNRYALSDTCTICCTLLMLVIVICMAGERMLKNHPQFIKYRKFLDLPLIFAFPLFAILMFALIFLYPSGSSAILKIDQLLTHRIGLSYQAIGKYGISLWGETIRQAGHGFSTFPTYEYEFVDSSYPLIFLQNGMIFFWLVGFTWARTTYLAIKNNNYRLAFGMGLIALHSFAEHHFTEMNYNILMFLPCAEYLAKKDAKKEEEKDQKAIMYLCSVSVIAVILLMAPLWINQARTICGYRRWTKDGLELFAAFVAFALLIGFTVLLICGICATSKKKRRWIFFSCAGALMILSFTVYGIYASNSKNELKGSLGQSLEILTKLDQNANGKLYSTEYPAIYSKELSNLKYSVFTGDDLARKGPATVIVPRGTEYYILLRKGFQYAAISEDTAIYTNDEGVLQTLMNCGKVPHKFFDEVRYVELPLQTAPVAQLRKGKYRVTYCFHVNLEDPEASEIADINIVGNKGYTSLYRKNVSRDALDENGNVIYEIELSLEGDMPGVMFYLLGTEKTSVEVTEVTYQQISN